MSQVRQARRRTAEWADGPAAPEHAPLKILISAYACEPGRGSEPGVGWNWVRQLAARHRVWVLTRCNNRPSIEAELARNPLPNAVFVYFDLPRWARFWKRGRRGLYPYYYLWQFGAYLTARRLHSEIGFDLAQHATFVMYWMPSFISLLPVPFVWGPVGGGEAAPRAFLPALSWRGRIGEMLRSLAQAAGRLDPGVRLTARRAALALATTAETEQRLTEIGCRHTAVFPVMALNSSDIEQLGRCGAPTTRSLRVASLGNLISWKGLQLGLRAFAALRAQRPDAEYWIIGDGPERQALQQAAGAGVRFLGAMPRADALDRLAECDVLLHPSLHDSGACVCTEAMAMGKPVVCLELGGPALQVTPETGMLVPAHSPEQAVADLALALERLASDPQLRRRMGAAGRRRVERDLSWDAKGRQFAEVCFPACGLPVQGGARLAGEEALAR